MENALKNYRDNQVLTVKDKISGFEGQVTGHADYITGCDQYLVQPPSKDGEWKDPRWFDESRLEVIKTESLKVEELQGEENGADSPAPIK
jgi:hypothetical protein